MSQIFGNEPPAPLSEEARANCLAYFRQAIAHPQSVAPWSEWWTANLAEIERAFSLVDYVRLKHRRLKGARQILILAGELARDFQPPSLRDAGSCPDCGERAVEEGGGVTCPQCGASG